MTNWEKQIKEIKAIIENDGRIAVDKQTNKVVECNSKIHCCDCQFGVETYGMDGEHFACWIKEKLADWFNQEAEEKILITQDEEAVLKALYNQGFRFIARDKTERWGDTLFAFQEHPIKNPELYMLEETPLKEGEYIWVRQSSSSASEVMNCFKKMFPFLKAEQPLEIKDLLNKAAVINLSNKKDDEL